MTAIVDASHVSSRRFPALFKPQTYLTIATESQGSVISPGI
jgi:hypothetical protein